MSLFEPPGGEGSLFERPDSGEAPAAHDGDDLDGRLEPAARESSDVHPTVSISAGSGSIPVRTRSVADALTGIQMPCDLAPLTGSGAPDDPTHVVFATEGHPAHRVGVSVGDELERIGCHLEPVDATTLWAERGPDSLEVRIHPDAATTMDGDERRFPTASEGSVVVEFSLR